MSSPTAIVLLSCPDQKGLVAKLANFIYSNGGNIIHADQHTDLEVGRFLSRMEWQLQDFNLPREIIAPAFEAIAKPLQADWQLFFSDQPSRIALWVSKQDHCLLDLLWRYQAGELPAKIPLILSNHSLLQPVAATFGIDFHHLPLTPETRPDQEAKVVQLLQEYEIDLVVLAKYMQILSPDFLEQSPQVINIHHSFLPAFVGANPYHQAYARGVKIIGATAHYVTPELDAGPIIEQDVVRVSHRDEVQDLIRKGKDLERIVLARAVRLHLQHRILMYNNRTVVF
ncbi:MAG: formyltetrahydrofolate deformylase [Synechococcaceae cyanobacterium SM2_3_1]|nr:formyltetrahydrofolate deformylase [Synechococcaceae cyanobacterium SM2_3_1]